jgi:hypothetical protein
MMARIQQFKLTIPEPKELDLHRQIADCLRLEIGLPGRLSKQGVMWWAYDISNSAAIAPGARTTLGIIAGIPDLMFLYRAKAYFQEIKRPNGILSDAQGAVMASARLAGADIAVCIDARSCLANLDVWAVPRSRRTVFPMEVV